MKLPLQLLFILLSVTVKTVILVSAAEPGNDILVPDDKYTRDEIESAPSTSETLKAESGSPFTRRMAATVYTASMTCDKYPKVCRQKGSPGRDCCKKKCVNVDTDRSNCGSCGHKCKLNQICCKGNCVNYLTDKKNCGGCKIKCRKGHKCVFGMCNYA